MVLGHGLGSESSVWGIKSVISAKQFGRAEIEAVIERAALMEKICGSKGHEPRLSGKVMAALFYEESTRTRLSFETAMLRLGGSVIGTENARMFSSAAKGESLQDTARIVGGYADVIVIRHYEKGASEQASLVAGVPVINAGDGPGEHPTQGLLDVYTIHKEFGSVEGRTVALVGDLCHGRTVRSLAQMLSHFPGVRFIFVAPARLAMGDDIKRLLISRGVSFRETEDFNAALRESDVVYMTRIQKERFEDPSEYEKYKGVYILDPGKAAMMRAGAIIMHPLPRVGEIAPEVDTDRRARYFEQARNGLYVRMALLDLVLGGSS